MDQYIGKLLDNRYELQEVIGTGGMAVVYKARCHRLNRLVAVKILKSELAKDADFRRRFHDESQAVAMLSHPNIVAVYDVSSSDDLDYIVMELIDGITLKQYMQKKGGPLNWREALHFITQIMKAISHAHSRKVIHRDIKPHNIMVLRDGSVKVADFGIARLMSATQSTLTQEALGSVHYISPEQARGSHIDGRADIYSAGVVLYEMITGRLPYEGDTPVSVAIQHINSVPLSPRDFNPDIPEALEAITLKAMASNVEQRYATADEMLADLEEFRKNPSINFDYSTADLESAGSDEPTQILTAPPAHTGQTGRHPRKHDAHGKSGGGQRGSHSYDDEEDRGSIWPTVIAVGVILAFLFGIGYFLWTTFFVNLITPTATYEVPSLIGKTLEEILEDETVTSIFTIEEGDAIESAVYEPGEIAEQSPEAGKMVKEANLVITVFPSAGVEETRMPAVAGMELRTALALLKDTYNLSVTQETATSDTVTKGYIISSSIEEGTPIENGDEVTIVISLGPEIKTVTITPLVGMTLEAAESQVAALGLVLDEVQQVYSDEYPEGQVVEQSLAVGTEVEEGTSIILTVSIGSDSTGDDSNVSVTGSTKTVVINLANYTGTVTVRVTVGGVDAYSSTVDTAQFSSVSATITGTGTQEICEYVDGILLKRYTLDFAS